MKWSIKKSRISALLSISLAAWLAATPARADHPPPDHLRLAASETGLLWESLDAEEQRLLRPHAKRWPYYSHERRLRLLEGVRRYLRMPPAQRRTLREQATHFDRLSPKEKRGLCNRYYRERGRLPPFCRRYLRR